MSDLTPDIDDVYRIPVLESVNQKFVLDTGSPDFLLPETQCKRILCDKNDTHCDLEKGSSRHWSQFESGNKFTFYVSNKKVNVNELFSKLEQKDVYPDVNSEDEVSLACVPSFPMDSNGLPMDGNGQMCFGPGICFGGIIGLQYNKPRSANLMNANLMSAMNSSGFEMCEGESDQQPYHFFLRSEQDNACKKFRNQASQAQLSSRFAPVISVDGGNTRVLFDSGSSESHKSFEFDNKKLCVVGFSDIQYLAADYNKGTIRYRLSSDYEDLQDLLNKNCI